LNDPVYASIEVILDLMLPQPDNFPPHGSQLSVIFLIPLPVAINLALPKGRKAMLPLRQAVSMPKVAVNKNHYSCFLKNKVRLAGQVCYMPSE